MYESIPKILSIASPGWSGLRGGTFGYVRSGGAQFHSGLDLFAEEGTPVYAMIDGVISSYHYVIEQPNRNKSIIPQDIKEIQMEQEMGFM